MSVRVTELRWQKRWLVTSCMDGMLGGSRSLAVYQQHSWISSILSCKAMLQFIVATLQSKLSSLLLSRSSNPSLLPAMCYVFEGILDLLWEKSEGQMGEWKLRILSLRKNVGFENINTVCPRLSPSFIEWQSIRLQTDGVDCKSPQETHWPGTQKPTVTHSSQDPCQSTAWNLISRSHGSQFHARPYVLADFNNRFYWCEYI